MKTHTPTGMFYRPGTADATAFKEVGVEYNALEIPAQSIVLDIGAHIGFFTKRALEHGAHYVIAVEPEPESFQYLKANFEQNPQVILVEAAVAETSPVTLYQKKNTTVHTIIPTRVTSRSSETTREVQVMAYSLRNLIDHYKPQVVKVDVESAELFWDWTNIGESVRHLAVELTLRRRSWLPEAQAVLNTIKEQGFTCVEEPNFDSVTWWDYSRRAIFRR